MDNPPSVTSAPVPQFSIPKGILGQPTCHTHPHMVEKDNLTCGITQAEFRERRETLVRKLAAEVENMHKTHIVSVVWYHSISDFLVHKIIEGFGLLYLIWSEACRYMVFE